MENTITYNNNSENSNKQNRNVVPSQNGEESVEKSIQK